MSDPLSRHPNIAAHVVLCALDDGVNEDLMAETDMVADILAGCATDPWFAGAANIVKQVQHLGLGACFKGVAVVVPDIADAKAAILHKLHKSHYADHVGIHRPYTMSRASVGGMTWGSTSENICKVVMCVSAQQGLAKAASW